MNVQLNGETAELEADPEVEGYTFLGWEDKNGNIEDQIRVANDLLRGLKILKRDVEAENLQTE